MRAQQMAHKAICNVLSTIPQDQYNASSGLILRAQTLPDGEVETPWPQISPTSILTSVDVMNYRLRGDIGRQISH